MTRGVLPHGGGGRRFSLSEKLANGELFRRTLRVYKQSVNTAPAA